MPFIDVRPLLREGLSDAVANQYRTAVESAWAEVAPEIRGLGSRPVMYLQLQDPARDRETVTVTIGIGGPYGSTSGKSPAELQTMLARHLRERFVPRNPSDSDLS